MQRGIVETAEAAATGESQRFRQSVAAIPYWTVVLCLIVAGFAASAVDVPLARGMVVDHWGRTIEPLLRRCEAFGFGVSVAVILVVVFVLDPKRRWAIPRVLLMVFGSGLMADVLKLFLARYRPYAFLEAKLPGGGWQTFGQWLPMLQVRANLQSFPSAHTATAVALAIALSTLYPRGRWLFFTLAFLVGCQRVQCGDHYLSDVCWGAALGWFIAVAVGRSTLNGIGIGRWEERRAANPA